MSLRFGSCARDDPATTAEDSCAALGTRVVVEWDAISAARGDWASDAILFGT